MLNKVRATLEGQPNWSEALRGRLDEFELLCIAKIDDSEIRVAVVDFLENVAPIEFYTAPASSTGKNHPAWQASVGGILLNTVECCVGIGRKIRMYPSLTDARAEPLPEHRDNIYVATILSDTFKPLDAGKNWREFVHHRLAAESWARLGPTHGIPTGRVELIRDAIYWHLGRFTPEWPEQADPRQQLSLHAFITHELDMDFSNRDLPQIFERKIFKG